MKYYVFGALLAIALLGVIASPFQTVTMEYFSTSASVSMKAYAMMDDKLTFTFFSNGKYDVSFSWPENYQPKDNDRLPNNFSVTVNGTPEYRKISQMVLRHLVVTITKNSETAESHLFTIGKPTH